MNNLEIQKHKIQILSIQEAMLIDKIKRLQDQVTKLRTKRAKLTQNIEKLPESELSRSNHLTKTS